MRKLCYGLLILLVVSCKSKDPEPSFGEMLINPGMEDGYGAPNGWYHFNNPDNTLTDRTSWSATVFSSGSHSLSITQPFLDAINNSEWGQYYQGITPAGKDITLSVKIKGDNITGGGVMIGLYGDNVTTAALQSMESTDVITGTFDWKEYKITLKSVQSAVGIFRIHLLLKANSTGTVYFDDASLTTN